MVARNLLQRFPPYPVERAMKDLGENLRTARIRRNMTIADAAARIGTGPRAVMDAEKGKPSTGLVVYAALLWLYDQLHEFKSVADPANDRDGIVLERSRERVRVRKSRVLDNDF